MVKETIKTIGIAHDYIEFEETDENGVNKNIQIPIIYINAIFKLMGKSGFCELGHIKRYGYQSDYKQKVNIWVHDVGGFDLKPIKKNGKFEGIKINGELY